MNSPTTSHVVKLAIKDSDHAPFTEWLVKVMMAGVQFPECYSAEVKPPQLPEDPDWKLIHLFASADHRAVWLQSEQYQKLIAEFKELVANDQATLIEHDLQGDDVHGTVAVAVTTDVKPEMEEYYRIWEGKIQNLQVKCSGYRGSFVQPPTKEAPDRWTTLVRFDTPADLERWIASEERKKRLPESDHFVNKVAYQHITNSFPGWFPTDAEGKGPPNWKVAMLVLLGLYPTVMLEIKFLNPLLHSLGAAPANFIGNTISVAFTTWVTVPLSIKVFKSWLLPTGDNQSRINLLGCLALIVFYIIEISLLYNLL